MPARVSSADIVAVAEAVAHLFRVNKASRNEVSVMHYAPMLPFAGHPAGGQSCRNESSRICAGMSPVRKGRLRRWLLRAGGGGMCARLCPSDRCLTIVFFNLVRRCSRGRVAGRWWHPAQ